MALHQLLQKHQFAGREDIHAWQTGSKQAPSYVVVLGTDVAVVLELVLAPVLGSRSGQRRADRATTGARPATDRFVSRQ